MTRVAATRSRGLSSSECTTRWTGIVLRLRAELRAGATAVCGHPEVSADQSATNCPAQKARRDFAGRRAAGLPRVKMRLLERSQLDVVFVEPIQEIDRDGHRLLGPQKRFMGTASMPFIRRWCSQRR